jgi:hypothetical protein
MGEEELMSLSESESVQSERSSVGAEDDGRDMEELTGGRVGYSSIRLSIVIVCCLPC